MFVEAGFAAYPIVLLGFAAVVVAARHALVPRAGQLPVVAGLGLASLLCAGLGTVLGIQKTIQALHHVQLSAEYVQLLTQGVHESLQNLVMALAFAVLAAVPATIGGWRARRPGSV
jgi:hypothetical protein